ncbi:MAG: hypothetical protein ABI663_20890 [Chryseolinea sp.]
MRIILTTSKMKWLGSAFLLAFALTLVNCGGDDESPALQATVEGKKISLKNAKIYLANEDTYNDYTYRDYFISDGVPNNSSPWSLSDYDDATFFIAVELATKSVDGLSSGTYPAIDNWSTATGDKIAYLYYEVAVPGGDPLEYDNPSDVAGPNVVVKGKFDGDDTMTLSFSGNMVNDDTEELVATNVYFSGKVVDIR